MSNKKVTVTYNSLTLLNEVELTNSNIVYNDSTIINDGVYTGTLKCKDKVMWSNITIGGSKTLTCNGKIMLDNIIITSILATLFILEKPSNLTPSATYTGSTITNGYTTPSNCTMTGNNSGTNAGAYIATYTPNDGYGWTDGTTASVTVTLTINNATMTVTPTAASKTYDQSSTYASIKVNVAGAMVEYGTSTSYGYSLTASSADTNYGMSSVASTEYGTTTVYYRVSKANYNTVTGSTTISIGKLSLTIPTLSNTSYTYDGSSHSCTVNNYNSTYENQSGTTSSTNVGSWTITWSLKNTTSTTWSDGTTGNKTGSWSIAQVAIDTFTLNSTNKPYIASSQSVSVSTCKGNGLNATYSTSGTWSATNAGTYTATVTGTGNFKGSKSVSWTIFSTNRVGGRIFYINTSSENTYTFYNSSGSQITDISIAGLANAYWYTKSSSIYEDIDKFYVYDNTNGLQSSKYWGYHGTECGSHLESSIGCGKTNTAIIFNMGIPTDYTPNIWQWALSCRNNTVGGCNDWYIGSIDELDQLRLSGLVDWFESNIIWSSTEYGADPSNYAGLWLYSHSFWTDVEKLYDFNCFCIRSF